jgi:hypothetical protein
MTPRCHDFAIAFIGVVVGDPGFDVGSTPLIDQAVELKSLERKLIQQQCGYIIWWVINNLVAAAGSSFLCFWVHPAGGRAGR